MNFSSVKRKTLKAAKQEAGNADIGDVFSLSAKVALTDQDFFGHMTNTRYNDYAHTALEALLIRAGALKDNTKGTPFSIVEDEVAYIRMLKYPNRFDLELQKTGETDALHEFAYTFTRQGKIAARGRMAVRIDGAAE